MSSPQTDAPDQGGTGVSADSVPSFVAPTTGPVALPSLAPLPSLASLPDLTSPSAAPAPDPVTALAPAPVPAAAPPIGVWAQPAPVPVPMPLPYPVAAAPYYAPVGGVPYQPAWVAVPAQQQPNGMGVAGMVLGIISLLGGFFTAILPILGLVLSIVGRNQADQEGSSTGQAVAGIVCNTIALVVGLILLVAVINSATY